MGSNLPFQQIIAWGKIKKEKEKKILTIKQILPAHQLILLPSLELNRIPTSTGDPADSPMATTPLKTSYKLIVPHRSWSAAINSLIDIKTVGVMNIMLT